MKIGAEFGAITKFSAPMKIGANMNNWYSYSSTVYSSSNCFKYEIMEKKDSFIMNKNLTNRYFWR